MATFTANTKSKNQVAIHTVSRKTGAFVAWVHPGDNWARSICGVAKMHDVIYDMAVAHAPQFFENDLVELRITDLSAEPTTVDASEF